MSKGAHHIKKVLSGGQTGVDRAALDIAMEMGLTCGGWCPKWRKAEDGIIPERYPLKETASDVYSQRTEWNVRDSDGTLIITYGKPSGGTALTIRFASEMDKPCLVLDPVGNDSLQNFHEWVKRYRISTLNIAGPRETTMPGIYEKAMDFLRKILKQ
ncbi:MAG: putative molybdenum carrier protein [Thermodesulfobacteriota bacterium]